MPDASAAQQPQGGFQPNTRLVKPHALQAMQCSCFRRVSREPVHVRTCSDIQRAASQLGPTEIATSVTDVRVLPSDCEWQYGVTPHAQLAHSLTLAGVASPRVVRDLFPARSLSDTSKCADRFCARVRLARDRAGFPYMRLGPIRRACARQLACAGYARRHEGSH
jgi:hypothetical protein